MRTFENTLYLSPVTIPRAKADLAGTRFADLEWVEKTGSTNADLVDAARSGAGDRALVADHQSAGRGRLDRRWEAPPGASLLMSVLVRPPFPATGPNLLATALGLAAVEALDTLASLSTEVALKWPNDVVAPGTGADGADLKLGGLLAEMTGGTDDGAVVVGIGLNVAWQGIGFPEDLAATATAVDLLGGSIDRSDLVVSVLRSLDDVATLADPDACEQLVDRYRQRCATIGRPVRVELPSGELRGIATDVTADGALVVTADDGTATTVTVGDVVHLRPAD
jgi:BirA family biotin operon repressor/biotin-[acetyl-CoA-carboxylase] ligase